ncbi:MAG: S8 family serine peptidase, partial [Anaerolineae bacterium]
PATTQVADPPEDAVAAPQGWYENDVQGVRETWNTLGITGTGVSIAVLDSGVDFGNPALNGRYAVQPATSSGTQAYMGWPIAFDDRSLSSYLDRPDMPWPVNWGWYVNANHAITGSGQFTFTHLLSPTQVCTAPGTSQSGRYLLGYHPDNALDNAPVLVADEAVSGTYDAVYVDLDYDGTFETKMDKDTPVGTLDLTGDGVPDVSAGMLYWIADGANPPPGTEAVYGPGAPVPAAGMLLAFMIDSTSESGGGHGTMCAGTAVGYDAAGVFTTSSRVASFYDPAIYGPPVQGPAPGAKVIAMGNVYAPGSSLDAWYTFTVLGYDGVPGTGDEPQVATLSYGSGEVDNDTWDWESRYLTNLNLTYGADSPLFIQSAGNGGPGYGTVNPPKAATGLVVGASVQYGTYNVWGISETVSLPSRVSTGDVAPFSGRGPGADGTRPVDLVANGILGTGAYPLNYFGDGTKAYVHWRGTSRSAPVVGGMAALVAQGFFQANGRHPTYEELHLLLSNGAHDLGYDPMVQGAGQANAFRSTQLALAQYGVTIDPPLAVAGDFRGERYPSFAAGLSRGQIQTFTFAVTNSSAVPITVEMDTQRLVQVARYTATIPTLHDTATNYGNGAPDYALNLTNWVASHPDADLMVVRMTEPFEHFDTVPPTPPAPRNSWQLMIYNWWDDSGDGKWWDDQNSDGRVDWPGEIDGGDEWMRLSYSDYGASSTSNYFNSTQQEVRVG